MSGRLDLPADFPDLLDQYCSGLIDDDGLRRLEAILLDCPDARREFVAYFQLHTELQFAVRARKAADSVLDQFAEDLETPACQPIADQALPEPQARPLRVPVVRWSRWQALAAGVLITAVGFLVVQAGRPQPRPNRVAAPAPRTAQPLNVAWLINAQDCLWAGDERDMPGRDMRAGKVLRLRRGLAEIEFERGARVILQGPAALVLLSGNEARLLHGTMTARVPPEAIGFSVLSPRGKVVDLGTEFGLTVDEHGSTNVRVFEGEVEAAALQQGGGADAGSTVTLHQDQAARIDGRTVAMRPAGEGPEASRFVRQIVPPPVVTPRVVKLDFARPVPGTIQDALGLGIGLTRRLPGTGADLLERDLNLKLNTERGMLELTTTRSDLNTQSEIRKGEYLGFRLADLGFTGSEDFAITATIPDIPALEKTGQFGLYAGSRSDETIRGGLISGCEPERYELFLVNNDKGVDAPPYYVRLMNTRGDDLRLTLQRVGGKYSLLVRNQTTQNSSTLTIAHPAFLDAERDLYVGLFGANVQSDVRKTLMVKELNVTVWTVAAARDAAASASLAPAGSRGPVGSGRVAVPPAENVAGRPSTAGQRFEKLSMIPLNP